MGPSRLASSPQPAGLPREVRAIAAPNGSTRERVTTAPGAPPPPFAFVLTASPQAGPSASIVARASSPSGAVPRGGGAALDASASSSTSPTPSPPPAADVVRPMSLAPSMPADSGAGFPVGGGHATPFDSSGGSGGGGGGEGPPPQVFFSGNPRIAGQTNIDDVVGDGVQFAIHAPAGRQLTSYSWTVSGGELSQTYYVYSGKTAPADQSYGGLGGGDGFVGSSFFWDQNTGVHTVNVTVTYDDGTTGKGSITANVMKPNVISFTNHYQPLQFGSYNRPGVTDSYFGFHQGVDGGSNGVSAATPGDQFTATVSTLNLPVGGQFAFIQKINANWSVTVRGQDYNRQTSGDVLDQGVPDSPLYLGYSSDQIPAGTASASIPAATQYQGTKYQGTVPDAPWLAYDVSPFVPPWTHIQFNNNFSTYLVYRAPGGIWVALSKVTWQATGDKTLDPADSTWKDTLPPLPGDPAPTQPAVEGTANGVNGTSFVSWDNSFDPGSPSLNAKRPDGSFYGTFWIGPNGQPSLPPVL